MLLLRTKQICAHCVMSGGEQEILLKYVNNVKETSDVSLFEIMKPFTSKFIAEHMHATLAILEKTKRKKFKFDIITGIYPNAFKHYYIDENKEEHIEECLVNVNVKIAKEKPLTFDEKVELLTNFIKTNKKEPSPGDMFNGFDVGRFYNTTLIGKARGEQIEDIVERFL